MILNSAPIYTICYLMCFTVRTLLEAGDRMLIVSSHDQQGKQVQLITKPFLICISDIEQQHSLIKLYHFSSIWCVCRWGNWYWLFDEWQQGFSCVLQEHFWHCTNLTNIFIIYNINFWTCLKTMKHIQLYILACSTE